MNHASAQYTRREIKSALRSHRQIDFTLHKLPPSVFDPDTEGRLLPGLPPILYACCCASLICVCVFDLCKALNFLHASKAFPNLCFSLSSLCSIATYSSPVLPPLFLARARLAWRISRAHSGSPLEGENMSASIVPSVDSSTVRLQHVSPREAKRRRVLFLQQRFGRITSCSTIWIWRKAHLSPPSALK